MAKYVFAWPAQLKNGQIFEIGHEMANVATLLCSTWYAMPVCDAIIVSTISRMLRAVATAVIIILNVRCW